MEMFLARLVAGVAPSAAGQAAGAGASRCTKVKLSGRTGCIGVGSQCSRRYERIYEGYGWTCVRTRDGRYRLRERVFRGTPAPGVGASPSG